jgi:CRISPR/Cas system-associated exonuclease Cas4 (RecB family)
MDGFLGLISFIAFIGCILLLLNMQAKTGFSTTGMKMRRAIPSPWDLSEFLTLRPSRWKIGKYYSFSEETVRSLGHRYVGRFDGAILHWEEAPVLDVVIEYKFPVNHLPEQSRPEDVFQAGLYALALMETGVSCTKTRLVTIYCLQDRAKRCVEGKSSKSCWKCGNSRIHTSRFNPRKVIKTLKRMDEVWYNGRKPKPTPGPLKCRSCPYSRDKCNYSAV